jgi:uncharacterized RDD family membrane protein YckC
VIKTCLQCGAVNGEPVDICCFCDASLGNSGRKGVLRNALIPAEGKLVAEPGWRREVSDRLQAYRVRRHGWAAVDVQPELPFEADSESAVAEPDTSLADAPPAPEVQSPARRRARTERVDISIPKHEIAYQGAKVHLPAAAQPGFGAAPGVLFPVASLRERGNAAILDVMLLLFSYGGMLALFWALGGRIGLNKLDALVTGATLGLFYAQYFALFSFFGGCTPGMMLCRLRVLSFDGGMPTSQQMIWRSFGYLVSAGTCFLGFFWALWDEDRLSWQDRISRTYLTPIEGLRTIESQSVAARESGAYRH